MHEKLYNNYSSNRMIFESVPEDKLEVIALLAVACQMMVSAERRKKELQKTLFGDIKCIKPTWDETCIDRRKVRGGGKYSQLWRREASELGLCKLCSLWLDSYKTYRSLASKAGAHRREVRRLSARLLDWEAKEGEGKLQQASGSSAAACHGYRLHGLQGA